MADDNTTNIPEEPIDEAINSPRLENRPAVEVIDGGDHSRLVELRTVENVMEDNYLRYSMSVIIDRALPDVRLQDGFHLP